MSLVQSRCRLDLVQPHLSIRFGRETSNKLSVIKLQKNVFLHWFQQQSFISRCWPIVECSFDFTNASLENPRSVGQMEGWPQLWHTTRTGFVASALRRNEFESGGTHPCAGKFLLLCPSTFFGLKVQLVVLVSAFVMVSTVWPVSRFPCPWSWRHCLWLCFAIDTHGIDTAVPLYGLPHTSVLCFNPLPPFFENSSDLHQSQDWP